MTLETTSSAAARLTAPHIVTELPGPRAQALIARDDAVVSPSLTRAYPLVAETGDGYVVTDVDGNRFLDFAAGIAVCSTGHRHPKVVEAIKAQADQLIHIAATDFYEPRYLELTEHLARIAPFEEKARVFLTNSGTEAVEGAIKLARHHTHRPGLIAFEGAFHGRTMGALSLTNSKIKQRAGFGPLLPMVYHAPYPRIRSWKEGTGGDGSAELEVLRNSILGRLIAPERRGGDRDRADPGRGRLLPGARHRSCAGCASCATSTASSSSPTRCSPGWAAPDAGGRSSTPAWSRTSSPPPRGSPRGCRSAPSSHATRS